MKQMTKAALALELEKSTSCYAQYLEWTHHYIQRLITRYTLTSLTMYFLSIMPVKILSVYWFKWNGKIRRFTSKVNCVQNKKMINTFCIQKFSTCITRNVLSTNNDLTSTEKNITNDDTGVKLVKNPKGFSKRNNKQVLTFCY